MSKGRQASNEDWVEYEKLQKSMYLQNKKLESRPKSHRFDPHKYFGGWTPLERATIESIKIKIKDWKLMEFDDSDDSKPIESHLVIEGKESSAHPSVAEENSPDPVIPKLKIKNTKSINNKLYLNKPYNRQAMTGFRNGCRTKLKDARTDMKLSVQVDPKGKNNKMHSISFKGDKNINRSKDFDPKKPLRKFNYLSQIKSTSSSFKSSTFMESNISSTIWEVGVNKNLLAMK